MSSITNTPSIRPGSSSSSRFGGGDGLLSPGGTSIRSPFQDLLDSSDDGSTTNDGGAGVDLTMPPMLKTIEDPIVPPVRTMSEFQSYINIVDEALKNIDPDSWKERLDGLQVLLKLIAGGSFRTVVVSSDDHTTTIQTIIYLMKHLPIDKQIEDLRSILTGKACQIVVALGYEIGIMLTNLFPPSSDATSSSTNYNYFAPLAELWLPSLFKLSISGTKVMAQQGIQCIRQFTSLNYRGGALPRLIPVLCETCITRKNHPHLKLAATMALSNVLRQWHCANHVIDRKYSSQLIQALVVVLGDRDPNVREEARKAYWSLHKKYPQMATNDILRQIDSSAQKHINKAKVIANAEWTAPNGILYLLSSGYELSEAQKKSKKPSASSSASSVSTSSRMRQPRATTRPGTSSSTSSTTAAGAGSSSAATAAPPPKPWQKSSKLTSRGAAAATTTISSNASTSSNGSSNASNSNTPAKQWQRSTTTNTRIPKTPKIEITVPSKGTNNAVTDTSAPKSLLNAPKVRSVIGGAKSSATGTTATTSRLPPPSTSATAAQRHQSTNIVKPSALNSTTTRAKEQAPMATTSVLEETKLVSDKNNKLSSTTTTSKFQKSNITTKKKPHPIQPITLKKFVDVMGGSNTSSWSNREQVLEAITVTLNGPSSATDNNDAATKMDLYSFMSASSDELDTFVKALTNGILDTNLTVSLAALEAVLTCFHSSSQSGSNNHSSSQEEGGDILVLRTTILERLHLLLPSLLNKRAVYGIDSVTDLMDDCFESLKQSSMKDIELNAYIHQAFMTIVELEQTPTNNEKEDSDEDDDTKLLQSSKSYGLLLDLYIKSCEASASTFIQDETAQVDVLKSILYCSKEQQQKEKNDDDEGTIDSMTLEHILTTLYNALQDNSMKPTTFINHLIEVASYNSQLQDTLMESKEEWANAVQQGVLERMNLQASVSSSSSTSLATFEQTNSQDEEGLYRSTTSINDDKDDDDEQDDDGHKNDEEENDDDQDDDDEAVMSATNTTNQDDDDGVDGMDFRNVPESPMRTSNNEDVLPEDIRTPLAKLSINDAKGGTKGTTTNAKKHPTKVTGAPSSNVDFQTPSGKALDNDSVGSSDVENRYANGSASTTTLPPTPFTDPVLRYMVQPSPFPTATTHQFQRHASSDKSMSKLLQRLNNFEEVSSNLQLCMQELLHFTKASHAELWDDYFDQVLECLLLGIHPRTHHQAAIHSNAATTKSKVVERTSFDINNVLLSPLNEDESDDDEKSVGAILADKVHLFLQGLRALIRYQSSRFSSKQISNLVDQLVTCIQEAPVCFIPTKKSITTTDHVSFVVHAASRALEDTMKRCCESMTTTAFDTLLGHLHKTTSTSSCGGEHNNKEDSQTTQLVLLELLKSFQTLIPRLTTTTNLFVERHSEIISPLVTALNHITMDVRKNAVFCFVAISEILSNEQQFEELYLSSSNKITNAQRRLIIYFVNERREQQAQAQTNAKA